jgi:D-aminoacyl-tRNA deacylase
VKLVVWTRQDPASERVAGALMGAGHFKAAGPLPGTAVDTPSSTLLMEAEGSMLEADYIERRGKVAAGGSAITRVLFLSKHSAASGKRSLTVHSVGNLGGDAKFGGQPRRIVPPDPEAATALLRALSDVAPGCGASATFESTHHGPVLEVPALFVEVGSTLADWRNDAMAEAVARAVLGAWMPLADRPPAGEAVAGVGGGHYHPKHTDFARRTGTPVGHLVPDHALADTDDATLDQVVALTGARRVLIDGRSLTARDRLRVRQAAERNGAAAEDLPA